MTSPIGSRAALGAILAALLAAAPAPAQDPFFAGETIELHSGYSDGSEGHVVMQSWARAFERLYPGTRVIVRVNSGGTAALTAELLAAAAPTGLTIGTIGTDSLIARAVGEETRDISQFAILGGMAMRQTVLFASTASDIDSLDDLHAAPAILPVRAATSNSRYTALLLNAWLGTRIQPVTGYSSSEGELAFITGEGALITEDVSLGEDRHVANGTGLPILVITKYYEPEGAYAEAPFLGDLSGDPDFAWVPTLLQGLAVGHLLAAPLDTPPDRLAALRAAFDRITADEAFRADIAPIQYLVASRGEDIESMVGNLLETFGDLGPLIAAALDCGAGIAETGAPCS